MIINNDTSKEVDRIREVYSKRDAQQKKLLYAWNRPDVRFQNAYKHRLLSRALLSSFGENLNNVNALDVGCGTGGFLRTLIEWGAQPENLVGTEFLPERLEQARRISPSSVYWHLGSLDFAKSEAFDLVSAHTVFSSILQDDERYSLAQEMWRCVKPGGWILIFDFRYNNPYNCNVRKVLKQDMQQWWPANKYFFETGLLAPPLARHLIGSSSFMAELMSTFIPFLRSHFVFMAQK
jgi:SAM-dependent methyltransferase